MDATDATTDMGGVTWWLVWLRRPLKEASNPMLAQTRHHESQEVLHRCNIHSCDVWLHSTPHLEEVCCCQVAPDMQSRLVIAPATVSCLKAADRSVVDGHATRLEERLFISFLVLVKSAGPTLTL